MKIVSTSYVTSPEFTNPIEWLQRISFYTGILQELSKRHEVLSIERINYEGEVYQQGVRYLFLRHPYHIIRFPTRMHQVIKKFKPDVVFVNGFFPFQVIQLKLALGKNVNIITIHRADRPFKTLNRFLQKIADIFINAYLFTSLELGKQWQASGNISDGRKIFEVMPASSVFNSEDKTFSKSELMITGSPVFLWVGRLDSNKDPLTVIKAFKLFLQQQPRASLYMIYQTGELFDELLKIVNEDNQTIQAIHFVGEIQNQSLGFWYRSADFFISGSHYESLGIAVCEAMSCGCIPIVTNIPSFRMLTANGSCGFIYAVGNVEELLSVLMKTKDLDTSILKQKIVDRFNTELSFKAIARKIESIIQKQ